MSLDKQQRQALKAKGQKLKPVVTISYKGLSENVAAELEVAFESHELIKVRINADDKDARQVLIDRICDEHKAELIQHIGFVAVFYRKKQD